MIDATTTTCRLRSDGQEPAIRRALYRAFGFLGAMVLAGLAGVTATFMVVDGVSLAEAALPSVVTLAIASGIAVIVIRSVIGRRRGDEVRAHVRSWGNQGP